MRFFLRVHMSLILAATGVGGFVASRLLHAAGLDSMPLRYGLSIAASYGIFLLCVRLWVCYITPRPPTRVLRLPNSLDSTDVVNAVGHIASDALEQGASGLRAKPKIGSGGAIAVEEVPQAVEAAFLEGGGPVAESSGNAATGTFFEAGGIARNSGSAFASTLWDAASEGSDNTDVTGAAAAASIMGAESFSPGGGSGGGLIGGLPDLDLDLDEDSAGLVIALVALGILLVVIFGAGAYLVYQAPVILSDAAFQLLLTWTIRRRAGEVTDEGWICSLATATVIPFLGLLAVFVATGALVQHLYPYVHSLGQLLR